MDNDLLRIYLNDHRAGAAAGVALCERCLRNNVGTEYEGFLRQLSQQMHEERRVFISLLHSLGIRPNPIKLMAAWVAERLGRLKLNGRVRDYSPLSRLWELESLKLAAVAKASLWRSLRAIEDTDRRLQTVELERFIEQADEQITILERHRVHAASAAFR